LRVIIVGLGNISFSDDGAGILVARALQAHDLPEEIVIREAAEGGLDTLDMIPGFDFAVIIDAVRTVQGIPGTVYRFELDQINSLPIVSPHDIDVLTALKLGKELGFVLPEQIMFFGIEVKDLNTPGDECSVEIKKTIPVCTDMVIGYLDTVSYS